MPAFIRSLMMSAAFVMLAVPAQAQDAPKEEPAAQEKPAETKPAETKPAEEKAKEAKPAETKPADDKSEQKASGGGNVKSKPSEPVPAKLKPRVNPEDGNAVQEWIAAENKLIDTLSRKDQQSFYVMRNKHSVIRVVRVVNRDIKNAVNACGKKNPDIKKEMETRLKDWEAAVIPTVDLAEKYLKEEIETQKIVFASDFKHVLKLNDKAYEYGESRIEKQPVTDKDACQDLLKSMDRTENKMVELLQDILLPESVIRERAARAEEAEEAEKARKAAE